MHREKNVEKRTSKLLLYNLIKSANHIQNLNIEVLLRYIWQVYCVMVYTSYQDSFIPSISVMRARSRITLPSCIHS